MSSVSKLLYNFFQSCLKKSGLLFKANTSQVTSINDSLVAWQWESNEILYILAPFALSFCLPSLLTCYCYVCALIRLYQLNSNRRSRAKSRAALSIMRVLVVHFACWIPYWTCQVHIYLISSRQKWYRKRLTVLIIHFSFF